jgi:alcohol dehydrogenase
MMGFFTSPHLCLGPGSIEQLSSLGIHRALVVVDPAVADRGGDRRIREELAKDGAQIEVVRTGPVPATLASLADGSRVAAEFRPDAFVAVGGGSTIDAAKGIWIRYARPELQLTALTPLTELRLRDRARFIAVPTTSGRGSEVAWAAHLWDDAGRPVEIASRELVPDWALLDPSLPATMPTATTIDSGLDALAHGLEALASTWATPFTDGLAREAIGTLFQNLPDVLQRPDDIELRGWVHAAATMAGLAVSNAQGGLTHAIAHAIGSKVGLSHGRLVAILLPWVLEFNFPAAREVYMRLADLWGPASTQQAAAFAERLRRLTHELAVPSTLRAAGVDVDGLLARSDDWMPDIRGSSSFGANPRIPSGEDLTRLVTRAFG